jgi:hypothetical protein
MVKDDSFGHALLAAVQAKKRDGIQRVLMGELESVINAALGIPEEPTQPPPQIYQRPVKGEFPHWRCKVVGGKEVDRRPVYSFSEMEALIHSDPLFSSVDSYTPVPERDNS